MLHDFVGPCYQMQTRLGYHLMGYFEHCVSVEHKEEYKKWIVKTCVSDDSIMFLWSDELPLYVESMTQQSPTSERGSEHIAFMMEHAKHVAKINELIALYANDLTFWPETLEEFHKITSSTSFSSVHSIYGKYALYYILYIYVSVCNIHVLIL